MDRHGRVAGEGLSDRTVACIVQGAAERAGLDPKAFAGHSLRAGFATTAAKKGKSLDAIMRQTLHKSEEVARGYIRHASSSTTTRPSVSPKGLEPLCLAAAEPKAALAAEDSRRIEKTGPTTDPSGPEIGGVHPGVGQSWGNPASLGTGTDQVEAALARALDRASEAGRFDVVAQLARELEARRLARLPNLVPLEPDGRGKRKP